MTTTDTSMIALFIKENIGSSLTGASSGTGSTDSLFGDTLSAVESALTQAKHKQGDSFDALLAMCDGNQSNTANADAGIGQLFAMIQQVSGVGSVAPGGSSELISGLSPGALQLMNEGGPLPAFLNAVDGGAGLTIKQQQDLWNIAAANMSDHPDVQKIHAELEQAGLPETVPASIFA